jgi:predicted  nucleic acid-binding Zn-ribbon protein
MNMTSGKTVCCCLTLVLLCVVLVGSAQAQSPAKQASDDRTIQSLLTEVRSLRQALQRTGLNAYRSQIVLERLRASSDQVERVARMLDSVRDEIERTEYTIPRMREQSKIMESQLELEMDGKQRARMEFEQKDIKQQIERYKVRLERLRERETQLSTQLRGEQTKQEELVGRLDALEREIENEIARLRAEEEPKESHKQP